MKHEDTIETRDGESFTKVRYDGGSQVKSFVNSNVENIWYMHYRGRNRFLQIRGDSYVTACTAWTDKFYTPDGQQVFSIPLGESPSEGYANIVKAFNNKQTKTYKNIDEKIDTSVKNSKKLLAKRK
ncbi:MAG: hypothetical protein HC773_01375 [Scytonema sp. CRU_2_7]|nr:hypothetical protein [Scytonema sp. CRU_2_7]